MNQTIINKCAFFQVCPFLGASLPIETIPSVNQFTQTIEEQVPITTGFNQHYAMKSEISREITEEIGSDTRMARVELAACSSIGTVESACDLSRSDLQTLDDAFSRLTESHGIMVHKITELTESGTVIRHVETPTPEVQGHPTCPYMEAQKGHVKFLKKGFVSPN